MNSYWFQKRDNSAIEVTVASSLDVAVRDLFGSGPDCTFVKSEWRIFSGPLTEVL